MPDAPIDDHLADLGFRQFGTLVGRMLQTDADLPRHPAVYVAVLDGQVFWVGETGDLRNRAASYRRWLAQPDDSPRSDKRARDQLMQMTGGRRLTFFWKRPMTVRSELTGKEYPAHRVEEAIFIDYFRKQHIRPHDQPANCGS